eukprot:TRINITY_DN44550_c0_g1_i1.p1 TRINITY_DN44550_c0_g1~~TRINITY_DN44550_c0_g1_i1.p1  ORF type:complete len:503 (-),score=63.12 TRINITY_DN44550_c0_g1_i1:165-1673(-)
MCIRDRVSALDQAAAVNLRPGRSAGQSVGSSHTVAAAASKGRRMTRLGYSLCRELRKIARSIERSKYCTEVEREFRKTLVASSDALTSAKDGTALRQHWRNSFTRAQKVNSEAAEELLDRGMTALRNWSLLSEALQIAERLSDPSLGLEEGARIIDHAAIQGETVTQALDQLADEVRASMHSRQLPSVEHCGHPAVETLYHINQVLYNDWGFVGNSADFYNPDNSCLSRVIGSRTGIPISLALVYGAICERLGLVVSGTDYPAVFLLYVHAPASQDVREPAGSLQGDWVCSYGAEGPQVVRIFESDSGLQAMKITGDSNVPAGELTWRVTSDKRAEGPDGATMMCGEVQLAGHGFTNPVFEEVEVTAWCGLEGHTDRVEVMHPKGKESLTLSRLGPTDPLLVNAFTSGTVMTREQCSGFLKHGNLRKKMASMSATDREQYVAPVENRFVFARMARNLEVCYHHAKEVDVSALWCIVDAACLVQDVKSQGSYRFTLAIQRFLY